MILNRDHFILKIADTEVELVAAQRLRYRVFVEEMGARPTFNSVMKQEADAFDPYFDHLVLKDIRINDERENVVGVYRLMRGDIAAAGPGFYSAGEYDLSKISATGRRLVELGRSCLDAQYRGGLALHLLWQGVADYVIKHDIELLFGVASFVGTDTNYYADALSFLYENHLAPAPLRVTARDSGNVSMRIKNINKIDRCRAVCQIPTLIKSYLRLGGFVGDGAYLDRDFNTLDVCVILDRALIPVKQRRLLKYGLVA
jgi:putative hemolysin